jgi:hypothetical protein
VWQAEEVVVGGDIVAFANEKKAPGKPGRFSEFSKFW